MFCVETKHVLLSVCWAGTAGWFYFIPSVLGVTVQADFLVFASHPCFTTAVGESRVFESCDSSVCLQCYLILD